MILTLKKWSLTLNVSHWNPKEFLKKTTVKNLRSRQMDVTMFKFQRTIRWFGRILFSFSNKANVRQFHEKNFSDFIVVFAAQNFAPNWVVLRVSWTVKKRTMDERRGDIFSCCFRETAALQRTKHGSGFCITAGYKIR